MSRTTIDRRRHQGHGVRGGPSAESGESTVSSAHRSRLWRHVIEMLLVMLPGMFLAGYLVVVGTGVNTWEVALVRYPTLSLVAMVAGMTAPMVGWMLLRRMGTRNALEMAVAMVVPVIPFLCLVWFGVSGGAWCGGYCAASVVAMLLLMAYRRDMYSMAM